MTISLEAIYAILAELVKQHGVRGAAQKLGLSAGYFCNVVNRRQPPKTKLLSALGYEEAETRYRKVN